MGDIHDNLRELVELCTQDAPRGLSIQNRYQWDDARAYEALRFIQQHGPALLARQEGEDAESVPATIAGWVHEDELPEGYPYDAMFPFSRVDIVRMFPVYVPRSP